MQTIPQTFKHGGYTYNLVKRNDKVAIYHVIGQIPYDVNKSFTVGYETHIIRHRKARHNEFVNPQGKNIIIQSVDKEMLASDNDFGMYAWFFPSLERADKRFEELSKK